MDGGAKLIQRELEMSNEDQSNQWPSVGLAFQFIEPSYAWMLDRIGAANNRIQQLQTFSATVTFAAPVLGRSLISDLPFESGWLYLALGMFVLTIGLGTYAVWTGTVKLLNPGVLHQGHLHKEPWRFKADLIYRAGEAHRHNGELVNKKWNIAVAMTVCFAVEVASLTAWILLA